MNIGAHFELSFYAHSIYIYIYLLLIIYIYAFIINKSSAFIITFIGVY